MLSRGSREAGQAVFVMYRFDYISRLRLSFRVNISAKCLTVPMNRVIILIQAVRLTLGAVLKWTFSKLPASNVGRTGVGVAGDWSPKCS